MDTHLRSVLKAASWRLIAVVITTAVAWRITGEPGFALAIGFVDTLIKIGAYYAHERAWNRVPFGKMRPPDYQI